MACGLAGIDVQDAGVGQGASEQFAVKHAGQLDVVGINGLAGGFGPAVGSGNVLSDDAVRVHGRSFVGYRRELPMQECKRWLSYCFRPAILRASVRARMVRTETIFQR
jgi:hypothetical protein